jgi:hypothetical protein
MHSIHDLSNLLETLRTRHPAFYYTAIVLTAFGIFGVLCLMSAFRNGVNR